MIKAPNYKAATNAAYEVLRNEYPFKLEIDILHTLSQYPNIRVHTYSELCTKFNLDYHELLEMVSSVHGFTIKNTETGKAEIFYCLYS